MTVTPEMRQRLADVKDRKRAARERIKIAQTAAKKFRGRTDVVDGKIDMSSPSFKAAQSAQRDIASAEAALASLEDEEKFYLQQMTGASLLPSGETFLGDPDKMTELARLGDSTAPIGSMNLGQAVTRDDVIAGIGTRARQAAAVPGDTLDYTGAGRTAPFGGVVAPLNRPLRLLDVIPSRGLDERVFPYVQSNSAFGTAKETAELAIKPEAGIELVDVEARAATIAHWQKAARQTLADMGSLQQLISDQLVFGVNDRLEWAIVNGDGSGENLLGVLNTTGVGEVNYDADALLADQSLAGITTVLLSNAVPNAVLVNPLDWQAMLTHKATGTGDYMSGGAFATTAQAIWGCPIIPSVSIAQGMGLVGDWTRGATLLVREGVNVRLSDSDEDDFLRNRVTLLGEGRFAIAIWQPACFCVVNFIDPS